ncbi:TrmH family RNA methyltransferase [Nocardioides limicola]|uniref:TrmH family RNA methyltransferase n=1 Tax=Nocardioides limicola TaxID=2803368 RepID=UPI00193C0C60|nr:RNA methyltransferase [Nocardioides sp. DJM-14]
MPPAPLTSGNARVKAARKLARRAFRTDSGRFLVDGPKALLGALEQPHRLHEVFATAEAADRFPDLHRQVAAADIPWILVDERAMGSLSDAVNPAGVVGVSELVTLTGEEVLAAGGRLVAICADVRDPGNAGTVIRCADAAGADGVVLAGDSVDVHNPKTVRATVGSLFHLPIGTTMSPAVAVAAAREAGFQVLAADGAGELDLDRAADSGVLAAPTAWLFGNEAWGLPDELAEQADHRVAIPIHGRAESLNLSTAAALCLYASARAQRLG